MTASFRVAAAVLAGLLVPACGPLSPPAAPAGAPAGFGGGEGKAASDERCVVPRGDTRPFVVEWSAQKRNMVRQYSSEGVLIAVHTGCGLEFLDGCGVGRGYDDVRSAGARDADRIDIGSTAQLKSELPIGYFELYGRFQKNDRWTLEYVYADSRRAKDDDIRRSQLPAHCAHATHFVSRIMLGAYRLRSAAARDSGAGAGVKGAGVSGGSGSHAEVIREGGDFGRCREHTTPGTSEACQAIVQVYMREIVNDVAPPVPPDGGEGPPAPWQPSPTISVDWGWITVTANLNGVPVLIDGIEVGKTPVKEQKVSAGSRTIDLQHDCVQPARRNVTVGVGETAEVRVDLVAREGALAVLAVDGNGKPLKADVVLGGKKLGTTAGKLAADVYNVSICDSGKKLEVRAAGHAPFERTVKITERQTTNIQAELKSSSPPASSPAPSASSSKSGKAGEEWVFSKPAGVWFTRSEITVDQYRACVNARGRGCTTPRDRNENKYCNWGYGDRGNHPINCIDWHQAKAVCEWLGGRLPTEDEWFKEASNNGARQYPWGDQQVTCDYAIWGDGSNTDGCGRNSTWPVCSKRKGDSVSGLCDMSGNVWEWTSSSEGASRVLRGGSWDGDGPDGLRASNRGGDEPTDRNSYIGVRCSRDN